MTADEFAQFDALVVELWPGWAVKGWTPANTQLVLAMLKPFPADACEAELRKQRFQKPDDTKPLWGLLRADLRAKFKKADQSPAEQELEHRAFRDSQALQNWIRGHPENEIHGWLMEAITAVPPLRDALIYACRFMPRRTLDGFVARAWSQGERFEDLTYRRNEQDAEDAAKRHRKAQCSATPQKRPYHPPEPSNCATGLQCVSTGVRENAQSGLFGESAEVSYPKNDIPF
jgi:hypothetical protein